MDRHDVLDSVVRLAEAEPRLPEELRDDLAVVRERLEESLGQTVKPAEAARLLGVTRAALKRWLDRDEIASVLTRSGRREIPIAELLDLVRAVDDARAAGSERALAAVMRARRRAADEAVDLDRLLPRRRPRTHRDRERQSLAYHRLVAERLTPALVQRASRQLRRWERGGGLDPYWAARWNDLLRKPLPAIRRAISADTVEARELRQSSPFTGVLTQQERRKLLDAIEASR